MINKIINIILNTFKRNNLRVMTRKLIKRLEYSNNETALEWAKNNVNNEQMNFVKK